MGRMQAFNICFVIALLLCACTALAQADENPEAPPTPRGAAPIDLVDNRVQVQLGVAGVPVTLLLDTGASTSLLFETDALNAVGLTFGETRGISFPAFAKGATGHVIDTLTLTTADGFSFEGKSVLYLSAAESIVGELGQKFGGILGRDFLSRFVVEIVPSESLMKIYAPGTNLSRQYRLSHDLVMEDDSPYLMHRFRLPWEQWPTTKKLLLDTGYPGGIVLWHDRHFGRVATPEEQVSLRAEGKGVVFFGLVRFSKLLYRNLPVFVGPSRAGQLEDRDGLIGASMFLPFRYVIDLPGGKLLLDARIKSRGIGYSISNEVIYTPGDEEFIIKDLRSRPSATPKDVYTKDSTEVVPE